MDVKRVLTPGLAENDVRGCGCAHQNDGLRGAMRGAVGLLLPVRDLERHGCGLELGAIGRVLCGEGACTRRMSLSVKGEGSVGLDCDPKERGGCRPGDWATIIFGERTPDFHLLVTLRSTLALGKVAKGTAD